MTSFLSLIYSIKFRLVEDNTYWNPTKSKILKLNHSMKCFMGKVQLSFHGRVFGR